MPAKAKKVEKSEKKDGLIYILIYFFPWLTGLIFYLVEKEDKKIRFHAMQSILLGIVIWLCWLFFFLIVTPFIGILLWLYGLYVGYKESQGETIRIPYLAEFADKYV
ncbi:MAG: hypothetical protein QXF56_02945 [Candidatus Micrarchaeia archaeon]